MHRLPLLTLVATAAVVAAVVVGAASATKPGPGASTGVGSVFVPNPVQSLGDESLTDQKDADTAVPAAAYHDVTLTHLDGSGFLHGDYATIKSETGNPAYSPTNTFRYTRNQDEFEQVMAYYWITEAQTYIQSLGFGGSLRAIDNQPQRVRINQYGVDNSFAHRSSDARAALRQGRCRRRRGRGGDPARVRARDPLLAELLVRVRGGRRDQRRLRRLLGGHRRRRRVAAARSARARAASLRRGLGLDLVHERPSRTACGASTRICTTRPTSTARSITTARSGRGRSGTSAGTSAT